VIDFHCHLDLYPNFVAVKDECVRRGMYVLSVTTTPSAWKGTSALALHTARIRTGIGLHPQLAYERRNELDLFDSYLNETRYVGEVGLDGSPEFRKHWESQVYVFNHVLRMCQQAGGRILSIHSRRAVRPVLLHLEKYPKAGTAVLHWFSGSLTELEAAITLGCWFSVGPAMLSSRKGRAIAAQLPKERVLTESDGPFAQINGQSLKPWDVETAVRELAAIWSLRESEAEQHIKSNLKSLLMLHEG